MERDEIIRMALESCAPNQTFNSDEEWVKRFAALVAEPWIETNKALAKEIIELKKQADQEPVGYFAYDEEHDIWEELTGPNAPGATPLYTAPQPVEQEPVAWMDLHKELGKLRWMGGDEGWDNAINAVRDRLIELATPHPVRTKDLTDDEVMQTHMNFDFDALGEQSFILAFARAVIAAYKEKNR